MVLSLTEYCRQHRTQKANHRFVMSRVEIDFHLFISTLVFPDWTNVRMSDCIFSSISIFFLIYINMVILEWIVKKTEEDPISILFYYPFLIYKFIHLVIWYDSTPKQKADLFCGSRAWFISSSMLKIFNPTNRQEIGRRQRNETGIFA